MRDWGRRIEGEERYPAVYQHGDWGSMFRSLTPVCLPSSFISQRGQPPARLQSW